MRSRVVFVVALLGAAGIVGGCLDIGGRQTTFDYSGAGQGMDTFRLTCDNGDESDVRLKVEYDARGTAVVTVNDGDDKGVRAKTMTSTSPDIDERLSGAAGTWTMEIERRADFNGKILARLSC